MREILVSGSTAYDTLLHYDGKFIDQFESADISKWLNMSVMSDTCEKNLWGVWANIAYNLALLGENPILLTSVGSDYSFAGIMKEKVNLEYVHKEEMKFTATATIMSDNLDNRITIFHPGAMIDAWESKISYIKEEIGYSIVSANHIPTMLEHARELNIKWVKIFADPAQQISQMSHDEICELIELSDYLIVNHYELKDLQRKWSFSDDELLEKLETIIVTYWEQGSQLISKDSIIHIDAIKVDEVDDTTWAGDAYRAWVLKAIAEKRDWKTACQLWTLLASYCVIASWSQNHHFSFGAVKEDMKTHFWVDMDLFKKRKY